MKWIAWETRRWVRWLGAVRTMPGVELPPGHGHAWYNYIDRYQVSFPVPLNSVAAALRTFWLELKFPRRLRDSWIAEGEHAGAWARGYDAGRKDVQGARERERREYQRGYECGLMLGASIHPPVIQITREQAERAGIRLPS